MGIVRDYGMMLGPGSYEISGPVHGVTWWCRFQIPEGKQIPIGLLYIGYKEDCLSDYGQEPEHMTLIAISEEQVLATEGKLHLHGEQYDLTDDGNWVPGEKVMPR